MKKIQKNLQHDSKLRSILQSELRNYFEQQAFNADLIKARKRKISFDNLPEAVENITLMLIDMDKKLMGNPLKQSANKKYLTVDGLRVYIETQTGKLPARQTVYGWIYRNQIPNFKRGKVVLFETAAVDLWLAENKRQSHSEKRREI